MRFSRRRKEQSSKDFQAAQKTLRGEAREIAERRRTFFGTSSEGGSKRNGAYGAFPAAC